MPLLKLRFPIPTLKGQNSRKVQVNSGENMRLGKFRRFALLLVGVVVTALPGRTTCLVTTACYGPGIGSDGLANTVVGGPWGNIVSYRFRAGHSGFLQQIYVYLIPNHPGYAAGTAGKLPVPGKLDYGSPAPQPSRTRLASYPLSQSL